MQYGNEWLIHKFNITKPYFEKIVKSIVLKFFKYLSLMKFYIMIKIIFYSSFFIIEQAFVRESFWTNIKKISNSLKFYFNDYFVKVLRCIKCFYNV